MKRIFLALVICLAIFAQDMNANASSKEVNVYSYRKKHLIKPILQGFTEKTGIKVNLITGKADALFERIKAEGKNSPADILLTTDAGRLVRAKKAGILQAVQSKELDHIPSQYNDDEGYWYGLSKRARVIFYAKDRVDVKDLSTYEDLASDKWKNKICIRSSSNVYNQSLLSSIIANEGTEKAKKWAQGIVQNMARKPQGGDRDQLRAIAAGQCDIAVANTYYYGSMIESSKKSDQEAAQKVGIFWPNQADRGAHINVSGVALTKSSKNKENAIKLMEYLASKDVQAKYAELVYEYPVIADVELSPVVKSFGSFKADNLDLSKLANHYIGALKIFDEVKWK